MQRFWKGVGIAALAVAITNVNPSFASMTATNVEDFHTMPLIVTRMDYANNSMALVLRDENIRHLNIAVVAKGYTIADADQQYEQMGEAEVNWGKTLVNADVSSWPKNQEIRLNTKHGARFYDDLNTTFYYALTYKDGSHFQGKVLYQRCYGPLAYGDFDMMTMERKEYSDEVYECRVHYEDGIASLDTYTGDYMSKYTEAALVGDYAAKTSYAYDIERKDAEMTGLPAGIKTLEVVAKEEEERLKEELTPEPEIVEVEKPVYVDKIVEVEKPVYVDRVVEAEKAVYVDKIVERERPVYMSRVVYTEPSNSTTTQSSDQSNDSNKLETEAIEAAVARALANYNLVEKDAKKDDDCEVEVPNLGNNTSNKPWWILIPVTALATFIACWWLLPDQRMRKENKR